MAYGSWRTSSRAVDRFTLGFPDVVIPAKAGVIPAKAHSCPGFSLGVCPCHHQVRHASRGLDKFMLCSIYRRMSDAKERGVMCHLARPTEFPANFPERHAGIP